MFTITHFDYSRLHLQSSIDLFAKSSKATKSRLFSWSNSAAARGV